MKIIYNCLVCNKLLSGKQRSFCSEKCKNRHFLDYNSVKERAFKKKALLIDMKGGECNRCCYKHNIAALFFYDKDGNSLHLNINSLANNNLEGLKNRLKNAQVLCRNCYEDTHNPIPIKTSAPDFSKNNLVKKFNENLVASGVKSRQTIVLGVSGGVDSVTMLDLFEKSSLNLNIIVAHLNHNVREDSDTDEILVKSLAKKHKYKFISKKLGTPEHYDIRKNVVMSNNLEEYLRDERKRFLLSTARDNGAKFVALAHNADDQAETFIMNALRGSGPAGLGAMEMTEDTIIRPLLDASRDEIESYARNNELEWHEDITNKDTAYTRNYIRHEILPLFSRVNPDFLANIGRTASLQRNIDGYLKVEAQGIIEENRKDSTKKGCITAFSGMTVAGMADIPKPVLYEAFGLLYEKVKGDRKDLSLKHLESIEKLIINSSGTKSLDLPGGIVARRAYDYLDFTRKISDNIAPDTEAKKLKLGTQDFGKWRILVSKDSADKTEDGSAKMFIDAEMLPNLIVRTRKPGDRICPKGLAGNKKLQDLFVDAKIDRDKRALWPIIENLTSNEVIWVPRLAISEVDTKEKNRYIIKMNEVRDESSKEE